MECAWIDASIRRSLAEYRRFPRRYLAHNEIKPIEVLGYLQEILIPNLWRRESKIVLLC
jgi:hypothetical protein